MSFKPYEAGGGAVRRCRSPSSQGGGEAKDNTKAEIEKYREMLADDNPAELYEAKGEEIWKKKRGPKNESLEKCDLGLGPGVVKGAYVQMPRYFADVKKVQDLESRLVHCMVTLQGFKAEDLTKDPFDTETARPPERAGRLRGGASRA